MQERRLPPEASFFFLLNIPNRDFRLGIQKSGHVSRCGNVRVPSPVFVKFGHKKVPIMPVSI